MSEDEACGDIDIGTGTRFTLSMKANTPHEGDAMINEPSDARRELSHDLLRVFEHALCQRELAAAEHVLCALEELARTDANCQAALDGAYLQTATVGTMRGVRTSWSK